MSFTTSLEQYQSNQTFGGSFNDSDLSSIEKAMEARSITGRETTDSITSSGAPLKAESLEKTLKLLTFRDNDIKLFRDMPNSPAYNTVEEFAQLVSYGDFKGGFITEGALPNTEDSVYRRRAELVKYMGVVKAVSHQMQLVKTAVEIGSAVQQEVKNGTMWILRAADAALTTGNASNVGVEFNGLYTQHQNYSELTYDGYHNSTMVIDLRGSCLTQQTLNDAAQTILDEGFGTPTTFYGPNRMLGEYAKDFFTKQRIMLGNNSNNSGFVSGGYPKTCSTVVGEIDLKYDLFMKRSAGKLIGASATSANAPTAVAKATDLGSSASIAVTSTDTLTKFGSASFGDANGAGDYYYAIAAKNAYGESALTLLNVNASTAVSVTTSTSIDMSWTDGGGAYPATCYVVYRTKKGAASTSLFYPIFTVSTAEKTAGFDGATATHVRDRNRFLPDTDQGFVSEFDSDVLMWKQLAPLMKLDLARIDLSTRFAIVLYGTPQLYAPKKMVKIINAGAYRSA